MKKHFITVAAVCALIGSMTMSSCIGSFSLTNKLLSWNQGIGSKFLNELVFFVFWFVPVYEVSIFVDSVVLNTIEFWSGSNPMACSTTTVQGQDGNTYLVKCDGKGYDIINTSDNSLVRLDFNVEEQTWSVIDAQGRSATLMTFVDADHVQMPVGNGEMRTFEISEAGVYAYQAAIAASNVAMR